MKKVELYASSLLLAEGTNSFYTLQLKTTDKEKELLIVIGASEAEAIMLALEKTPTPRPLTHEIVKTIGDKIGFSIQEAIIYKIDVHKNVFYALLRIHYQTEVIGIEARPSDAIAIAIRMNAPIYTYSNVIEEASSAIKISTAASQPHHMKSQDSQVQENQDEKKRLQQKLQQAINLENYEEAGTLRDKLNELGKMTPQRGGKIT